MPCCGGFIYKQWEGKLTTKQLTALQQQTQRRNNPMRCPLSQLFSQSRKANMGKVNTWLSANKLQTHLAKIRHAALMPLAQVSIITAPTILDLVDRNISAQKRLNYREVQPVRKSRDASTLRESYVNIRGLSNRQTRSLCKLSLLKKTISFRSFRAATEVDQLSKNYLDFQEPKGSKPILPDLSYQLMATQVNSNETTWEQ